MELFRRRPPLRLLAALAATATLLAAGFYWFRGSTFARVDTVFVTGVSSSEGKQVRAALTAAGTDMSTLNVDEQALRDAVRQFASVADLRIHADFPHDLTVEVVERRPVAAVNLGGQLIPVGAGGRLMRGVRADRSLPTLKATRIAPGSRLADRKALAAVAVLAGAPEGLRTRIARAFSSPKGLTLELRNGPQLIFGDADATSRKWMAATRVLADTSAAGAVYLDVRVPGRVAAGGLGTLPAEDPVGPAPDPQVAQTNPQPQPENTTTLNP